MNGNNTRFNKVIHSKERDIIRVRTHGKVELDDFDRRVIGDTIREFYIVKKVVPTIPKMLPILQDKISWKWSMTSLRTVLRDMGFKWKKSQSKLVVFVERQDIVNWRVRYIRNITKLTLEGKEIFYLDETWVDNNLTLNRCWQKKGDIEGVMATGNAGNRHIIAHVGSEKGFLADDLLMYKAGAAKGDYHGQMNSDNFEKWLSTQVIPKLPSGSIGNGKQTDMTLTKYAVKEDMI
ncbi:hypothetical protein ANN_27803 [Periplaneta americana]|uniref:Uncharacterized protein n=1 Tax=Periplaneta americana TaxID=6978 RepID=A0ABQ8RV73_PERAM|nr:hypothetical protein ANN_27803 [Periplaneta americana]